MKAWQTAIMDADAAWQAEAASAWEQMNRPDPYEGVLKDAATDLEKAVALLRVVIDHLSDASVVLSDTPMQAKVDSFIDSMEDVKFDLWELETRWEGGRRE